MAIIKRAINWANNGQPVRALMELLKAVREDPSRREVLDTAVDIYLRHISTPGVERDLLRCLDEVPNGIDVFEMIETSLENDDDDRRLKALRSVQTKEGFCVPRAPLAPPAYAYAHAGQMSHAADGNPVHRTAGGYYEEHDHESWGYANPPYEPAPGLTGNANRQGYSRAHVSREAQHTGSYRRVQHTTGVHAVAARGAGPAANAAQGGWPYQVADDLAYTGPLGPRTATDGLGTRTRTQEPSSPWSPSAVGAPTYTPRNTRPVTGLLSPERQEEEPRPAPPGPVLSQQLGTVTYEYPAVANDFVDEKPASTEMSNDALYQEPRSAREREGATTGIFATTTAFLEAQDRELASPFDVRSKTRLLVIGALVVVTIAAVAASLLIS